MTLPRLAVVGVLLLCLAAAGFLLLGEGNDGPDRPHVVIFVMDTARADRCGVGGYEKPTTPSLDALAREGVNYRRAWAPCSWTAPSHASLFTGLDPQHHGLRMGNSWSLAEEARTLAEILRDEGYRTASWSDNPMVSASFGLVQGFEKTTEVWRRGPPHESRAHDSVREALAWAREVHGKGERFFLFVNAYEPHLPYAPPRRFQDRFLSHMNPRVLESARTFQSPVHLRYCVRLLDLEDSFIKTLGRLYDAELATTDDAVGKLVEGLREEGILDETLFVVTSDHGEALGEQHMIGHNLSMRRWLLQVPLLIRYPRGRDAGRVVNDLVRLEDVMPTCLENCGVKVPDGLDARSLDGDLAGRFSRGFLGPPMGESAVQVLKEAGYDRDVATASVTDGRWHYLLFSNSTHELFDLSEDPGENTNLAGKRPDIVERLSRFLTDR